MPQECLVAAEIQMRGYDYMLSVLSIRVSVNDLHALNNHSSRDCWLSTILYATSASRLIVLLNIALKYRKLK